jgi:hypothetical protein
VKLSEAAERVIELAHATREYWETELPKRHPDYPIVNLGEDSGPPPPEESELRTFLAGLPAEMIYKLILVMYLGRGDFGTSDLAGHFDQLKETFAKPEWAISQMMEKAPLAEYMTDGLAKLSTNGIEVDKLPLKPTKQRR